MTGIVSLTILISPPTPLVICNGKLSSFIPDVDAVVNDVVLGGRNVLGREGVPSVVM